MRDPATQESPRRHRERLLALFEEQVYRRALTGMRRQGRDADFWRTLCPDLAITDTPFQPAHAPRAVPIEDLQASADRLTRDGYFATGPLAQGPEASAVRSAVRRLADAGLPSVFACVYDAYWRLFQGLELLLTPLLGEGYLLVPNGLWVHHVRFGDSVHSGWSAAGPHRDSLGLDPYLIETGRPGLLNIWIALTDATPLDSCIYVLPASVDDSYLSERGVPDAGVPLQDVRAVPAAAGAVLGWTSHLLHWGSRPSTSAQPRMAAVVYMQRRDIAPFPEAFGFDAPVPFMKRLQWVARSVGMPDLF